MIELYIFNTSTLESHITSTCLSKRSTLSVLSHDIIRFLISRKVNMNPREIKIEEDKYGKKFVDEKVGVHFNISYSGDWMLIGMSRSPIGVDIERIRTIDYRNISRHFSLCEQHYIHGINQSVAEREYFRIWTGKESFVKYMGTGLKMPLHSFSVPTEPGLGYVDTGCEDIKPRLLSFELEGEYSISVCF
ncbi:4'-phosphopantetheinyl transferase family protein [Rossellomorea vietnamensis]|uniref:4'-phosphopantetheinyl transferase family protein n=1 Tax=Rossellomorea vietnamensis TaxID=218284 RepID=UPI00054F9DB4|nr:4'-phosphopantetheinyl transferase superfamily protein [Rossellomorea vietnamensis]